MSEEPDRIVISGISGRLPESRNIEEFKHQLFDGVDMVTDDDRRWPAGLYGLPKRTGKLKDITRFDASFFGVPASQAHFMDPQIRLLLEVTHESMIDAGINPSEFRGSNTGVFVGSSLSESSSYWNSDAETSHGLGLVGTSRNMLANRISYAFDFTGPSYTIDTACSSSMFAFQQACDAITLGRCEAALVGGTNLLLDPNTSLNFQQLGVLSSDGKCKTFDSAADGYVRSEAVVVVLIQKSSRANRIYATVLGTKSNTDGYKKYGITFPSGDMQKKLIREVYTESKVDLTDVVYVEAHGTGTTIGDPPEVNAIADGFCVANRKIPLIIGSVKSNMGHPESVSGLCSLVKVILAMESGKIPANLHYNSPNPDIRGLLDGRLKVVAQNEKWDGGIVGVNSSGFGGTNVHVILCSHLKPKVKSSSTKKQIPRLITVSGRTQDSVNYFLDKIIKNPFDEDLCALLDKIHKNNIPGHIYRGFGLIGYNRFQEVDHITAEKRPIWFVFSGMGSQWPGMGKALMNLEPFKRSIDRSAKILKPYGIDLINIIVNDDETTLDNVLNSYISITSIQIALVDILKLLNIEPDGIIGHSAGEISSAYADNTITSEQAILIAHARGTALFQSTLPIGAMAAIGLTWEECKKRVPTGIYPACHNAEDSVTISGSPESINKFVGQLISEGIFAKVVNTAGFAFHSKYISDAGPKLKTTLDAIITSPKVRSSKWISSSIPASAWHTPLSLTSSAEYHVNNFLSPVYFYEATRYIPRNAIVLEIAPHCLLQPILKKSLANNVINIGLLKREHPDGIKYFLINIGKIYKSGRQPNISALYPTVSFPVSKGTPMLGSMVKWDHSKEWAIPNYYGKYSRSGELSIDIDLNKEEYKFLTGHQIDGINLFPVTGYMILVWTTFAKLRNHYFENLPVVFEDVKFLRAVKISIKDSVKFLVNIFETTGEFQISESGSVVACGKIYTPANINNEFLNMQSVLATYDNSELPLNNADIYKELRLSGYEYKGIFKGIVSSDNCVSTGKLEWKNNWISYIDTMLQFYILGQSTHDLYLVTRLDKMIIDPKTHTALNLDQISINMLRKIDVLKSGGIELRDVKFKFVPRRHQKQVPKLEKYVFIPLENKVPLSEESTTSIYNALTVASQLVFENSSGALKLKVVEIASRNNSGVYILPKVHEIMEAEPSLNIEATIISSTAIDVSSLGNDSIQVVQNYAGIAAAHLVILTDALITDNNEAILNAKSLVKSEGFILFEEPKKYLVSKLIAIHSLEIVYKQVTLDKIYILARKPMDIPKTSICVEISYKNYCWVDPLKEAMRLSENTGCKIYIFCQEELSGVVGLINCLSKEPAGINVRCFFIQDKNAESFSLSSNYYINQLRKDLVHNVYKNGIWGTYRHLLLDNISENTSYCEHAYINTVRAGDLSSLKWIEGPLKFYRDDLNTNMCTVYYAPLNLRDIMLVTGKLPPDVLFGAEQDYLLGQEFSGRDSKGRRVMGLVASKGLATTVLSDPVYLWDVPEQWSLEEAATIPVAYGTSYYALIIRGNIKPGQTILIHAITGGVCLASISIALNMGCKVFTTVDDQSKRNFLKNRFPQLTDGEIGYSSDSSFEQLILSQTRGRGVDFVLTREQLKSSMKCLAFGGRFLEIGKIDHSLVMTEFSKNATYHGIILDALFTTDYADKVEINRLVSEGIINGVVRPLPNVIFTEYEVESAFRSLASGCHVGKVSLKIRDEECQTIIHPSPKTVCAIQKSHMDPEKVYILVGGLGGFGLELTNWLINRGARKIILSSRSGVKSGYQAFCLRRWRNKNVVIHIFTIDVTTAEGAEELIKKSKEFGSVGGIFNLAVVLSDSFMETQTEEDFKIVCSPKINATKHLDAVSRILTPHLDYFVVFSSLSCGRGNSGQANYGFANSAMERICENRQAAGLPALAIQWASLGEVGLIAETMPGVTELAGTALQNVLSYLSTFDVFLQQCNPVLSSLVLPEKTKLAKDVNNITLTNAVANIIGLTDSTSVSGFYRLDDVGLDSLNAKEVQQTLEKDYDLLFSLQEIKALTFDKLLMLEKETSTHIPNETVHDFKNYVRDLVPKEPCIRMISKESSTETTVFMIPPIESNDDTMADLAREIEAIVYGLHYTLAPLTSISELARYLIMEVKKVQAKGPYTIIGYSFGVCVAFEIAVQLEANDDEIKLILIDGSPDYIGPLTSGRMSSHDLTTEYTNVVLTFLQQLEIDVDYQKMADELIKMKSCEDIVKRAIEIISSVSSYPPNEVEAYINNLYKGLIAADTYKPSAKFKGEVLLLKASESSVQISEDYGLKTIFKQKITIKMLNSTNQGIISNLSLVELVNDFL